MPNPIIMIVDADPHVLQALDTDLQQRYPQQYRVVQARSGMRPWQHSKSSGSETSRLLYCLPTSSCRG